MATPPLADQVASLPYQSEPDYPITALCDARNADRYKRARAATLRKAISARRCIAMKTATPYQIGYFAAELATTRRYLANLRAARAVRAPSWKA